MRVVIIEEQESFARYLEQTMGSMHRDFNKIDTFPDFFEFAQKFKKEEQPDLLLLDVYQLNDMALHFMKSYNITSPLLFTNSLKSNTPDSFFSGGGAIENFITPNNELFSNAQIARLVSDLEIPKYIPKSKEDFAGLLPVAGRKRQRFLVKNKEKLISVKTSDIGLFYAEGRLNFIITKNNRKFIVNHSMEVLNSLLDQTLFFRINRAMIISFDNIKDMYTFFGGRIKIVLHTPVEKDIIVSRDKVADFKKWLGE